MNVESMEENKRKAINHDGHGEHGEHGRYSEKARRKAKEKPCHTGGNTCHSSKNPVLPAEIHITPTHPSFPRKRESSA
jgi:hypothetical protein